MPSVLSHPAIPLALGLASGTEVVPPSLLLAGVVGSVLPDLDALGYGMGIPYGDQLGHRGLTHSLSFALVVALVAVAILRNNRRPRWSVFLFVFIATASHGILDAMTTGGLGVAFFSPFSNYRYFLPWRVIAVSPIGVTSFFSEWGVRVLLSELWWLWFPGIAFGCLGFVVRRRVGFRP